MMKRFILALALASASFAQHDVDTIIQRSVNANAEDWKAAPNYEYFERDRQQIGGTKTDEERMIFGSQYEQLIAIDGKPLSPEQQAEEQQKLDAAIVERQKESPQERAQRIEQHWTAPGWTDIWLASRKRPTLIPRRFTNALSPWREA